MMIMMNYDGDDNNEVDDNDDDYNDDNNDNDNDDDDIGLACYVNMTFFFKFSTFVSGFQLFCQVFNFLIFTKRQFMTEIQPLIAIKQSSFCVAQFCSSELALII